MIRCSRMINETIKRLSRMEELETIELLEYLTDRLIYTRTEIDSNDLKYYSNKLEKINEIRKSIKYLESLKNRPTISPDGVKNLVVKSCVILEEEETTEW